MNDAARPALDSEAWQRLREFLAECEVLSPEERSAALDDFAIHAPTLAALARETLAAGDGEIPLAVEEVLPALFAAAREDAAPAQIGPFTLLRPLGAGGMGTVHLAERRGADFRQQVALKLIDAGTARLAARERRILAALAHPNIAAFVDAGVDHGRAWLAMEYVDGQPLLAWCARHGAPLRERMRLFAQVCAAVAHAHAQLVVHRDLKPANVLVDAQGNAKLLDFGIARVLGDGDEDAPTRVFTPEYAAPEQLRGAVVGTATDVFALGLMLYELVAGTRLADKGEAPRADWSRTELVRRAAQADNATWGEDAAAALRGDAGRIAAHALAADPAQRYASVASLREDVERWLDHRPLAIARPALAYLAARFARRHRAAVAVATVAVAALAATSAIALWQAHAKSQEAQRAQAALRRAEAIGDFLGSLFVAADPLQSQGVKTPVGDLLAAARTRIHRELAGEPAVAAELLDQIGNTYVSLGDEEAARAALADALAANARADPPSSRVEGSAGARLAYDAYIDGDAARAERELDAIVTRLRGGDAGLSRTLGVALRLRSAVRYSAGKKDEALADAAEGVALLRNAGANADFEYLYSLLGYADLAAGLERGDVSLAAAEQTLAHPRVDSGEFKGARVLALAAKARALQSLGRDGEAEPLLREAVATQGALIGTDDPRTRYTRYRHAQSLETLGRLDEAQAILDALLAHPVDGEHPVARSAVAIADARVASARHAPDASARIAGARELACSGKGNPDFCAKARALR